MSKSSFRREDTFIGSPRKATTSDDPPDSHDPLMEPAPVGPEDTLVSRRPMLGIMDTGEVALETEGVATEVIQKTVVVEPSPAWRLAAFALGGLVILQFLILAVLISSTSSEVEDVEQRMAELEAQIEAKPLVVATPVEAVETDVPEPVQPAPAPQEEPAEAEEEPAPEAAEEEGFDFAEEETAVAEPEPAEAAPEVARSERAEILVPELRSELEQLTESCEAVKSESMRFFHTKTSKPARLWRDLTNPRGNPQSDKALAFQGEYRASLDALRTRVESLDDAGCKTTLNRALDRADSGCFGTSEQKGNSWTQNVGAECL